MEREEMQCLVNEYFFKLGNENVIVNVRIVDNPRIIAGARGVKIFGIPLIRCQTSCNDNEREDK